MNQPLPTTLRWSSATSTGPRPARSRTRFDKRSGTVDVGRLVAHERRVRQLAEKHELHHDVRRKQNDDHRTGDGRTVRQRGSTMGADVASSSRLLPRWRTPVMRATRCRRNAWWSTGQSRSRHRSVPASTAGRARSCRGRRTSGCTPGSGSTWTTTRPTPGLSKVITTADASATKPARRNACCHFSTRRSCVDLVELHQQMTPLTTTGADVAVGTHLIGEVEGDPCGQREAAGFQGSRREVGPIVGRRLGPPERRAED